MATNDGGFIGQDGLNAPDSPTGVSATAGSAEATISFTAPSDVGGSAITGYRAQSNDGIGASASSSPITVTGLTNGTSYTFNVWAINASGYSAPSDASGSVTPVSTYGTGVAHLGGGYTTTYSNQIITKSFESSGTTSDFGDLTLARQALGALASSTRGVWGGGTTGSASNVMDYVTLASAGNATDFGDLNTSAYWKGGLSNDTRGLFWGGPNTNSNYIDYITIASTGNASDFGDITMQYAAGSPGFGSTTRGILPIGVSSNGYDSVIEYVAYATTGNSVDFGDMTVAREKGANGSSSTRGLMAMGNASAGDSDVIDYITIASTGNATDFGDMTPARGNYPAAASNSTALMACGGDSPNVVSTNIVLIATTGNAVDWGDLTTSVGGWAGCSGSHGGIA